MFKGIVVLLVLLIGGLTAFYFMSGSASFDPNQQGRDAMAKIEAAMKKGKVTWKDVVKLADKPQEYCYYVEREQNGLKIVQPAGRNPNFDAASLESDIKNKVCQHGFKFFYDFGGVAFTVDFDGSGAAEDLSELKTAASLLNP